jgi:hypothetical protein
MAKCEHHWKIIAIAYSKDYQHPNCFNNAGISYGIVGKPNQPWGQPVTVYTLQCNICGDVKDKQVDGKQKPICEHIEESILKNK